MRTNSILNRDRLNVVETSSGALIMRASSTCAFIKTMKFSIVTYLNSSRQASEFAKGSIMMFSLANSRAYSLLYH